MTISNQFVKLLTLLKMSNLMKKILFCLLIIFSTIAIADNSSEQLKYCKPVSKYANDIMYKRQQGTQAKDLFITVTKHSKDQSFTWFYVALIKEAYKHPVFKNEEEKKEVTKEFADKALKGCLDSFNV